MKISIKNNLVIVAMLGVITGYANLTTSTLSSNPTKKVLLLENVREGQRLIIKSTNGTIFYEESISASGQYKKEFDLTALPNGAYFFELDKDFEIKIIPFTVNSSEVVFKKEDTETIFKPVVTLKDNTILINKLSPELEPLSITIYYDSGGFELIPSEEIEGVKNIQKAFKLLKNVEGRYKVISETQGRVLISYFKV